MFGVARSLARSKLTHYIYRYSRLWEEHSCPGLVVASAKNDPDTQLPAKIPCITHHLGPRAASDASGQGCYELSIHFLSSTPSRQIPTHCHAYSMHVKVIGTSECVHAAPARTCGARRPPKRRRLAWHDSRIHSIITSFCVTHTSQTKTTNRTSSTKHAVSHSTSQRCASLPPVSATRQKHAAYLNLSQRREAAVNSKVRSVQRAHTLGHQQRCVRLDLAATLCNSVLSQER